MRGKGIRYIAAMQQLRTKGKRITSRRRCRSLLPCYAGVGMGTGTTDWNLEGTNGTDDAGKKCGASRSRPQPDPGTYYSSHCGASAERPSVGQRRPTLVVPPERRRPPQRHRSTRRLLVRSASHAARRTVAPLLHRRDRDRLVGGGRCCGRARLWGVDVSCRRVRAPVRGGAPCASVRCGSGFAAWVMGAGG